MQTFTSFSDLAAANGTRISQSIVQTNNASSILEVTNRVKDMTRLLENHTRNGMADMPLFHRKTDDSHLLKIADMLDEAADSALSLASDTGRTLSASIKENAEQVRYGDIDTFLNDFSGLVSMLEGSRSYDSYTRQAVPNIIEDLRKIRVLVDPSKAEPALVGDEKRPADKLAKMLEKIAVKANSMANAYIGGNHGNLVKKHANFIREKGVSKFGQSQAQSYIDNIEGLLEEGFEVDANDQKILKGIFKDLMKAGAFADSIK